MAQIRGKSVVVFEHGGKYLFTVCFEQERREIIYIPVGGGIEFGEHSLDAARREVMEEISQEIKNEKLLAVRENIFTYNGIPEHEIVFIYSAEFKDPNAYLNNLQAGINSDGTEIKLVWVSLSEIEENNVRIYPDALLEIISSTFENTI